VQPRITQVADLDISEHINRPGDCGEMSARNVLTKPAIGKGISMG
jgi:hypothetical protein